ncbi:MAG: MBL fold metallo-hydrolase [Promethearchaeati archaeon SRVP18_Atabeyarchaeia-1]
MQVSESVYDIELKLPFQDTPILNVYVIDGGSCSIVIDTGMGDAVSNQFLIREIEKLGIRRKAISYIINTHEHIEHFSGNYALTEATGARIIAHSIAAEYIEWPTRQLAEQETWDALPEEAARQLRKWSEFYKSIKPTKVHRRVKDGDMIEVDGTRLRVVHTPGHAKGHICLYDERRKALFSGDQVLGSGTPYVGKWPDGSNGDMVDYIDSLKKLKELDMQLMLPSHGPVVTEPYKRIDETIERKLRRERAIIESLADGRVKSIWSLTREVYNCAPGDVYFYSSCVLAYLSKLKSEGRVEYSINGFDIQCRLKK